MPGLPATGELSYNGYTFDGASHVEVSVEFIHDDANRTVISHRHTISVSAIIHSDSDLDSNLENIRKKLGENGRSLVFKNKGFGDDISVNVSGGGLFDVASGPHPRILTWDPIGDNKSCEITWEVVTTIPVCDGEVRRTGVMALNYRTVYDIDEDANTTRTIEGFIQIVDRQVGKDSADRYRRLFAALPIPGYKRRQSWSGNFAKSRVDFRITDTQIPSRNAYPPGVTNIKCNHRSSWKRGKEGRTVRNTIDATITLAASAPPEHAFNVFATIVAQRALWANRQGHKIFFDSLDIEEDIFSRTASFSASYRFLSPLYKFIESAGLWRPIGTTWDTWIVSLRDTVFNRENRGSSNLRDIPGDDVIVNLCGPTIQTTPNSLGTDYFRYGPTRKKGIKNEKPPEEESYLEYRSEIVPMRRRPVTRQSVIQDPDDDLGGQRPNQAQKSAPFGFGPLQGIPNVLQTGGVSEYMIRLLGKATRAGHKIPRTSIESIGGQKAVESSFIGWQRLLGYFFGVAVYEAYWVADYLVSASPGFVEPLDNELDTVSGQSGEPRNQSEKFSPLGPLTFGPFRPNQPNVPRQFQ